MLKSWDKLSESQKAALVYIGILVVYGLLGTADYLNRYI
jgi:hypothetical protein